MNTWEQNNNSAIEKKELRRLLSMSREYGIKQKSIGVPYGKIEEMLDSEFYNKCGLPATMAALFIYKAKLNWSNKGIFILIEDGNPNVREIVGGICLFRFLVYNSFLFGKLIINYRMSEIVTHLSSAFDPTRFNLTEELKTVPCLFIQEVDAIESSNIKNSCSSLLDSIFFHRSRYNKPTIISLSIASEEFPSPGMFGKSFSDLIQNANREEVFRIKLTKMKS